MWASRLLVTQALLITTLSEDLKCDCQCRSAREGPTSHPHTHQHSHWSELVTDAQGNVWLEEIEEEVDTSKYHGDGFLDENNEASLNVAPQSIGNPEGAESEAMNVKALESPSSDNVNVVTVVYDSLCPFSRQFLLSMWNILKQVSDSGNDPLWQLSS
eukprot:Blabericola_migrator_1__8955@NODE_4754_length_994_cov_8_167206_g2959_i0_p1_GENE_NODE_4754_length_994_cov_8_167206_g2959_i0NODE_4754_length_994_cov_8_167206_g2959_i0_p1_ORF_typecomplete_len158_score25_63INCENP_N/PF12178_8/0_2_NODE_4754_length_994_cov_8_167206_g2959_i0356829